MWCSSCVISMWESVSLRLCFQSLARPNIKTSVPIAQTSGIGNRWYTHSVITCTIQIVLHYTTSDYPSVKVVNACTHTHPNWVSQSKGDCKWKALGYCNDEHGHTNNEELDKKLNVLVIPRILLNGKHLNAEPDDENDHRQNRNHGT